VKGNHRASGTVAETETGSGTKQNNIVPDQPRAKGSDKPLPSPWPLQSPSHSEPAGELYSGLTTWKH